MCLNLSPSTKSAILLANWTGGGFAVPLFVNSANQLTLSSKLQNTVGNLQPYGGFETGNNWVANATTIQVGTTEENAHTGSQSLKLEVSAASGNNAAHTDLFQVRDKGTVRNH